MENKSLKDIHIIPSLDESIRSIKSFSNGSSDLLINLINICGIKCAVICCEGLVSTSSLCEYMIKPLTEMKPAHVNSAYLLNFVNENMMFSTDKSRVNDYDTMFSLVYSGFAVLAADGSPYMLAFGMQGQEKRSITEPAGENDLTGAHEGFVENIRTNMSLIRRRIKSPLLVQKLVQKGSTTVTDICISFMSDRVPRELTERIESSLDSMRLEGIFTTGYVKPFLEPRHKRIFSSAGLTERPDVLCSRLMEGRVAVFIDGNPYAIYIPKLMTDNFQTLDDYNFKPYFGTFLRWLKYAAFLTALLLPALYTAIAVHHPELLNSTLLLLLADSEENAPFSITAETAGVLIMYEIIKEAGVRLPRSVGGAVSIAAGIMIGDSAVEAGLISTPLLTVAAVSVISGFVLPELSQSIPFLRIVFVICGGIWGLFGISLCGAVVLFNMCSTEDYGFPYTSPFSPFIKRAMGDTLFRSGFRKMQDNDFTVEELHERYKKQSAFHDTSVR